MRCFTALEMPPEVQQAAGELIGQLKPAGGGVKWVPPQNLHLTLKFLGEVDPGLISQVAGALEQACQGRPPLDLELLGMGAFPGRGRPQVIWLGLAGDLAGLGELARAVVEAMAGLGFAPEKRAFKPHLTIGRLRRGRGRKQEGPPVDLLRRLAALGEYQGPAFLAGRVALIQSTLTPAGAVYQPLHEVVLGEQPG